MWVYVLVCLFCSFLQKIIVACPKISLVPERAHCDNFISAGQKTYDLTKKGIHLTGRLWPNFVG